MLHYLHYEILLYLAIFPVSEIQLTHIMKNYVGREVRIAAHGLVGKKNYLSF